MTNKITAGIRNSLVMAMVLAVAFLLMPMASFAAEKDSSDTAEESTAFVSETAKTAAAVQSGTCGDNLRWSISGSVLTISGSGEMYSMWWNCPWASYRGSIIQVNIGGNVTSIGDSAFRDFTNLRTVTIPNKVTRIDSSAFAGCKNLRSVTIGNHVTIIGNSAFEGCSNLLSITFTSTSRVTEIGSYAFKDCSNLRSVTIPWVFFLLCL